MKRFFPLLILWSIITCWANAQQVVNYDVPQQPTTLKILGVGNSFTDDGMMYLPELLESAGIKNVVLGRLYIGGCTLQRHCEEYAANAASYVYFKSTHNKWVEVSKHATLTQGIEDESWDIVVIQQASGVSGLYQSYMPWTNKLMDIIRLHNNNAGACIAWQQTWSYSADSSHPEFPRYQNNSQLMYDAIIACNKQLLADTPIRIVIPSGTTIQNLRKWKADAKDYTRDGFHLSHTLGRYAAACTWFQALIAPAMHTTVWGNPCTLQGSQYQITIEEAKACQDAARKACIRSLMPWE